MMKENLERTFSADPFAQMGGYLKRFRGLTIYGKLENPSGNRIERVFTPDGLLDADHTYKIAFVTAQGVPKKIWTQSARPTRQSNCCSAILFQSARRGSDHRVGRFIPV